MESEKGHVVTDEAAIAEIRTRLRRAEGQIGGVIRMMDSERSCQEIVTQLAAISKAIDKAAFTLISTAMRECVLDGQHEATDMANQLQKLFLTMA